MKLNWDIDLDAGELRAPSKVSPMCYVVYPLGDDWAVTIGGQVKKTGTLGACLQACEESEEVSE